MNISKFPPKCFVIKKKIFPVTLTKDYIGSNLIDALYHNKKLTNVKIFHINIKPSLISLRQFMRL